MDIVKDNQMYMRIAQIAAERSYAKRLKVGCVIVKNHSIISFPDFSSNSYLQSLKVSEAQGFRAFLNKHLL